MEMKFKGTPGPWIKGDGAVYAKGGSDIAAVFDGISDDVLDMDMEIVKANVKLITAAPELLDALIEMQRIWGELAAVYPSLKNEKITGVMDDAVTKALK